MAIEARKASIQVQKRSATQKAKQDQMDQQGPQVYKADKALLDLQEPQGLQDQQDQRGQQQLYRATPAQLQQPFA